MSSTTAEIKLFDKMLQMNLQKERVKLQAGSLANRALSQTLSNADIKTLRDDDQVLVR